MDSLARMISDEAVERLRRHDASLFTADYDERKHIMQRLGWTDLAEKAPSRFTLLEGLAQQIADEGATDILLLGMGGSSLAPLVLTEAVGGAPGAPRLHVLDTTSPRTVMDLLDGLEQRSTFVVLASKSGTTIEPLSLYAICRSWLEQELERPAAGKHCIVITDPGTPLEKLRQREVMRVTLNGVPTVGGRFSALSMFGLAPATLAGVDVRTLVERAHAMESACAAPAEENPGALLAAWLNDRFEESRDKLTLVCSEQVGSFGLWVEQLVAESTGKKGTGIVPVLDDRPVRPPHYGDDRAVVVVRLADDTALADWSVAVQPDHPVFEIVLSDPFAIGGEFVRWEVATALLGYLLGINPFDEPNVAEAKRVTGEILDGTIELPHASADVDGVWVTFAGGIDDPGELTSLAQAVSQVCEALEPPDYVTLLAYLPDDGSLLEPLREALRSFSAATRNATCFEIGPRYLHSTGQLHKGGPSTGSFLLVTARDRTDSLIPGQSFTLGALYRAQAEGDLVALARHERPVVRFDLPEPTAAAVELVAAAIRDAAR